MSHFKEYVPSKSTRQGDFQLTESGQRWLGSQIDDGQAVHVGRANKSGREVYDVDWRGQTIRVIYDTKKKFVITVLGFVP